MHETVGPQAVDMERQLVYFTGQVQGVGFRYTARRVASRYPITGFVRNLPDGRVELMAEGTAADVERYVVPLRQAMGRMSAIVMCTSCQPAVSSTALRFAFDLTV